MRALTVPQATQAKQALSLLAENRAFEALAIAKTLVAQSPRAADAFHLLALCESSAGQSDAADRAFQAALKLLPNQRMFLENYAIFCHRQGRGLRALELRQQLATLEPTFKNVTALGKLALDLRKLEVAVKAFSRACEVNPGAASAFQNLSAAWQKAGEYREAEKAIQRSIALQASAGNWSNYAYLQRISGRADLAEASYRVALGIDPLHAAAKDGLSGALIDSIKISAAIENAEALVESDPSYVQGHITLANLRCTYDRSGLGPPTDGTEEADSLIGSRFERAAAKAPANGELQMAWLNFLLESKQFPKAIEAIQRTRSRFPRPILDVLEANALEQLNESLLAAPLYEAVDRLWGHFDISFINTYIRHLLKLGKIELAAEKAQLATSLDPECQESWAYQATIWRLLNDSREFWLCDYEQLIEQLPLDFAGLDATQHMQSLRDYLERIHQAHSEPLVQSVRGGLQTPGVLLGRPEPSIASLETMFRRALTSWTEKLPKNIQHPFLRRNSKHLRFVGSWSVKLKSKGNHSNHFHSQGWISSAFYVTLPPSVANSSAEQSGSIQFGQPPAELGLELAPRRVIKPLEGHLVLFPSYLWHGTVPFTDSKPRVTVAFDAIPIPATLLDGRVYSDSTRALF